MVFGAGVGGVAPLILLKLNGRDRGVSGNLRHPTVSVLRAAQAGVGQWDPVVRARDSQGSRVEKSGSSHSRERPSLSICLKM